MKFLKDSIALLEAFVGFIVKVGGMQKTANQADVEARTAGFSS